MTSESILNDPVNNPTSDFLEDALTVVEESEGAEWLPNLSLSEALGVLILNKLDQILSQLEDGGVVLQ